MQHDEKIPKTPPSASPVPDTGIAGNVPTVIGKENMRPISELPPVKVEGLGGLVGVREQPGDEIVVEGLSSPEVKVKTEISEPVAPAFQSITQVQKEENPENKDNDQNVIPFRIKAKGDPLDTKVVEAKIEVREEDRKKQMGEEGIAA